MKQYKAIADYYDAECTNHEMLQTDVPFFLEHARKAGSVLELAVGTGRAAIPIAQAGHRVTGIDYDRAMLKIAQQKRDQVGLRERQLRLVRANLLDFELDGKFDWICLFFNTFLAFVTLSEQDRLLQRVRRHLKPRGRFWLDIFQPNLAILARDVSKDLDPMTFYVPHLDRTVYRATDVRRDPARQVQRITFNYVWFDRDGQDHRQKTEFDLTFIFPRELRMLIERHGMRIEKIYGNYDGSELEPDSPRMIACVRGS